MTYFEFIWGALEVEEIFIEDFPSGMLERLKALLDTPKSPICSTWVKP